jgi:hypothetical protein
MEDTSGRVRSIYCHFDGYPEGVGKTLLEYWTDPERITALLDLGDLSILGEELGEDRGTGWFDKRMTLEVGSPEWTAAQGVTVAYGRDRGESGTEAERHSKDEWPDYGQEFDYLYVPSLGQWFVRTSDWSKYDGSPAGPWTSIPEALTTTDREEDHMARIEDGVLTAKLVADKVTPGAVRFTEPDVEDRPLSIYLRKEQVEALGATPDVGTEITLTLETAVRVR